MRFNHALMENNITNSDIKSLIHFLNKKKKLTQSENVIKFEKEWSKWLGVKYSVFVNSGSSANLLTIAAIKILYPKKNEIIVPTLTWSSDLSSVIHHGFKPIFVDIDPQTLSMNNDHVIKKINKQTAAVFLTHVQGFCGITDKLINFLKRKKIPLLEDVCESHGATYKKKKLGTYGLVSNFSFYYAHHMTTIEGGIISTNDEKLFELFRSLRSHGLAREILSKTLKKFYIKKYQKLSKEFIFLYPGYNVRNTELGAVIGRNQLKNLDKNIIKRNNNFKLFLKLLDSKKYITNYNLEGCSNYAFPLVLKYASFFNRNKLEKILKKNNIEFRRGNAGGGNMLRQPFLKKYVKEIKLSKFKEVDHIHFFGYYIGNFPDLKNKKIYQICKILNSINFKFNEKKV